jgi:hypothetical protein
VYADEICIRDVGGYAMQYNLWDTYTNRISPWSPTFSAQVTRCVPVADIRDAQEGHPISPRIFVKGFADSFVQVAIQSVVYKPGAGQAHYTCLGSTTSWYCNLDTEGGSPGDSSLGAAVSSDVVSQTTTETSVTETSATATSTTEKSATELSTTETTTMETSTTTETSDYVDHGDIYYPYYFYYYYFYYGGIW